MVGNVINEHSICYHIFCGWLVNSCDCDSLSPNHQQPGCIFKALVWPLATSLTLLVDLCMTARPPPQPVRQ